MRGRPCGAVALLLAALSCRTPRTQIVVPVCSDLGTPLPWGSQQVRLHVDSLDAPAAEQVRLEQTVSASSDPASSCGEGFRSVGSFSVQAAPMRGRVRVVLDAMEGGASLVSTQAVVSFLTSQTLVLQLDLPDRCRYASARTACATDQVCARIGCDAIVRSALPTLQQYLDGGLDAQRDAVADALSEPALDPPAPRLLAPFSQQTINSSQPTLSIALPAGVDGAEVRVCRTRACTNSNYVVRSQGVGGLVRVPTPLAPGAYFWVAQPRVNGVTYPRASATWQFWVARGATPSGASRWAPPVDVNGDGFADLVVGAGGNNRVYVYLGSAMGIPTAPGQTLSGPPGSYFGRNVVNLGDINGDGFTDVFVGSELDSPGGMRNAGSGDVFLGSATGLSTTSSHHSTGDNAGDTYGASAAAAGDVNGDGYGDLLVASPSGDVGAATENGYFRLYLGGAGGLERLPARSASGAQNERRGWALAGLGDVNGDGYGDYAVGAPGASPGPPARAGAGSVFLQLGGADLGTPASLLRLDGQSAGDAFGGALAAAGDLDGDGLSDLLVGAPLRAPNGSAVVYLGERTTGARRAGSYDGTEAGERVGSTLAGVGDADGDGAADFVAGSPYSATRGAETGAATLLLGPWPSVRATRWAGLAAGERFGSAVSGPGDLDGDGLADVAVAAYLAQSGRGRVSVFAGARTAPTAPSLDLLGPGPTDELGDTVASRGAAQGRRRW